MRESFFFELKPHNVLSAIDAMGQKCGNTCMALNSLENRVYEVPLIDGNVVIAKFYRPLRWSKDAILEEHTFLKELQQEGLRVCPPLEFSDNTTIQLVPKTNIFYALFPKSEGRAPEEFSDDEISHLGELLARIHKVGLKKDIAHRPPLTPQIAGIKSLDILKEYHVIPQMLVSEFNKIVSLIVEEMQSSFYETKIQRIHGDCHPGNLLYNNKEYVFLDFDDTRMGPAIQDVWMLLPSQDNEGVRQRELLIESYDKILPFDKNSIKLVESLRALRYLQYSAWITVRWEDPSFKHLFPHYGSQQYWEELLDDLKQQWKYIKNDSKQQISTNTLSFSNNIQTNHYSNDSQNIVQKKKITTRIVDINKEEFQKILMVRTEVFVEEFERDIDDELDGKDRESIHIIAEDNFGRAVGALRMKVLEASKLSVIDRVAVLYGKRKNLAGSALVKKAEEVARKYMSCSVKLDCPDDVCSFFETLGYKKTNETYKKDNTTYFVMKHDL